MPWIEVFHRGQGSGFCRSCGAPITWGETVKNRKKIPFDGEIVAVATKTHPETGEAIDVVDSSVTTSHFATCKDAKQWRGR